MLQAVPLTRVPELHTLGANARHETKYSDSEMYYKQALEILEQATAQTLNDLGVLAQTREQFELAAIYYQQAYGIRERLFGLQHAETIESLGDLAGIYEELENYPQAEENYEQALTLSMQLGRTNLGTALALSKAARFDRIQKRYNRAVERFQQSLALYETYPEGTDLATVLNNLGFLYCEMEQFENAEPILKRAVELSTRLSGEDHPNTAASLKNLAMVYASQGNDAQAEELYQRALNIYKHALGPVHSATVGTQKSYDAFLQKKEDNAHT